LRQGGWIPGVVYGQKSPVNVQMEQKALRRALRIIGTTQLADLRVGDQSKTVLVREIQQHLTRGDVMHVDFLEVDMAAKLRAEVELVSIGEALPEEEGLGVATLMLRHVEVECFPDDLPAEISVDLSAIRSPDDVIHVRDLRVPDGVEIMTDADLVVARFEYAAAEEEEEGGLEEAEESAEEVEVISKGKKDEEGDF
ncbi:MAG TPA: 50S ribosomal protein L25, partial [Promineifilum sp.]